MFCYELFMRHKHGYPFSRTGLIADFFPVTYLMSRKEIFESILENYKSDVEEVESNFQCFDLEYVASPYLADASLPGFENTEYMLCVLQLKYCCWFFMCCLLLLNCFYFFNIFRFFTSVKLYFVNIVCNFITLKFSQIRKVFSKIFRKQEMIVQKRVYLYRRNCLDIILNFGLIYCFFSENFSVLSMSEHSNRDLTTKALKYGKFNFLFFNDKFIKSLVFFYFSLYVFVFVLNRINNYVAENTRYASCRFRLIENTYNTILNCLECLRKGSLITID